MIIQFRQYSILLACLPLAFCGCQGGAGPSAGGGKSMTLICDPKDYDLACMKDEKTATSDDLLDVLGGARDAAVDMMAGEVDDVRQDEYGEQSRAEIAKEFPIVAGHKDQTLLEGILHRLLGLRLAPSKIDYNIYVVASDMVNAFTVGGEIFVTEALLAEVESKDELACIIGHEIGHNELGHIADQLRQVDAARSVLGDEAGESVAGFIGVLTMGFNQRNEAESDLYGIDLAIAAGYDACRGIDFWERLQSQEAEANDWENFFRSHPYSSRRANCYRSHISTRHHYSCN